MNLVLHYHANTTLPLSPVISHVGLSVNHAHHNTDTHTVYITDAHTLWFPLQNLRKPDTFLPHRLSRRTVQARREPLFILLKRLPVKGHVFVFNNGLLLNTPDILDFVFLSFFVPVFTRHPSCRNFLVTVRPSRLAAGQ